MLAFLYLALVILFGDAICRRFLPFVSTPHRIATAALSGLLVSTWVTYLGAAAFGETSYPMLTGNLIFAAIAIGATVVLNFVWPRPKASTQIDAETTRFTRADWIVTTIFAVVAMVMMLGTFSMKDGNIRIANHQSSDFGSTASIMQSFAIGHNFPTEYPHYTGDRIRYHFLFYFQAGNLQYLGLSPAASNNTISIMTLLAMLILVMTLGSVMFASRLVGRIGAILFFFHGSLAFIPFYLKSGSLAAMWEKMGTMRDFLTSGLPYRGEDWGVWSQVVYLNQRHLASSIGILLIVIIFLAIRQRERAEQKVASSIPAKKTSTEEEAIAESESATDGESDDILELDPIGDANSQESETSETANLETNEPDSDASIVIEDEASDPDKDVIKPVDAETVSITIAEPPINWPSRLMPFIFAGGLLGLMPMWNGAVFAGAAGVLAIMFFVLPYRREMIAVAAASGLIALPQVLFLKTGLAQPAGYSLWYFGYTVTDPTIYKVLYYLAFTFGFKWIFIAIAIIFGSRLQRLLMLSFTALVVMATCFQFSEEVLANHKFFNVWLVLMNVPVAFGIVTLWNILPGIGAIFSRIITSILVFLIVIGGVIDIFPVKNSFWVEYRFQGDPLVEWVRANTDPRAIFLSHRYVNHGILVAGRRLFYGHPYYAWGAGYPTGERDNVYRRMFESKDINEVFSLLKNNKISYVAIDNLVRKGDFIRSNNEKLYEAYFPVVYTDTENKYDSLKIYSVPETLGPPDPNVQFELTPTPSPTTASNAFTGGEGNGNGQFSRPRGIVADDKGNFFVADTGNGRIQKFNSDGTFIAALGKPGNAEGELREPNGIALDDTGNIYVTDAFNHKLVKMDPSGQVLKEWKGPDPGFYGPRDIAVGPDKKFYIVDQGRTRIVKFDPATESFTSWGTGGNGDGQFNESTGAAVGNGTVFVADTGNNRIQIFDLDGNFQRQWDVPAWERYIWHYPDIEYDESRKMIYVSNGWKKEILTYDLNGNLQPPLWPVADTAMDNPGALKIVTSGKKRYLLVINTSNPKITQLQLNSLETGETAPKRTK